MKYSLRLEGKGCQRVTLLSSTTLQSPQADRRLTKSGGLSTRAYTVVKCLILDQEIAPGAAVAIDVLAEQLGVSQTPVREALARLEGDGLVARRANGRLHVAALLDRTAFEQLYEMRLLLEPEAAALAAAEAAPAGLATLSACVATMTPAAAKRSPADYAAFVGADAMFHEAIARIGRNRFLFDAVRQLHSHHRLAFLYRNHGVTDWQIARREHAAIAAAIDGRDPVRARQSMRDHITRSREVLRRHFLEGAPAAHGGAAPKSAGRTRSAQSRRT